MDAPARDAPAWGWPGDAAPNAGARYAEARMMEMRAESMAARNRAVESLERVERVLAHAPSTVHHPRVRISISTASPVAVT